MNTWLFLLIIFLIAATIWVHNPQEFLPQAEPLQAVRFRSAEPFGENVVESHDFHIAAPGTFADDGSFTNDMSNYLSNNDGPL